MLEAGGEPDLALEPFRAERSSQLGEEDFERDRPVVLEVLGEVDSGHTPAPERALEGVTVAEAGGQRRSGVVWGGNVCDDRNLPCLVLCRQIGAPPLMEMVR